MAATNAYNITREITQEVKKNKWESPQIIGLALQA